MDKYTSLAVDYHFQPIMVEMLGPINKSASDSLTVVAHKISQLSGDEWETLFLFQHISVLLQQGQFFSKFLRILDTEGIK